jgi:uncharacterized protein involved in copper resistance
MSNKNPDLPTCSGSHGISFFSRVSLALSLASVLPTLVERQPQQTGSPHAIHAADIRRVDMCRSEYHHLSHSQTPSVDQT